jgi:hypothetical protein
MDYLIIKQLNIINKHFKSKDLVNYLEIGKLHKYQYIQMIK